MVETSTIVTASIATVATSLLAYTVYFDHKRRTDSEFRRSLRRETRRAARAEKERADAATNEMRKRIRDLVEAVNAEGFPTDKSKREEMFMQCIQEGDVLSAEKPFEAAVQFYKGMKVYTDPKDLLALYDSTLKKEVLDIVAELAAADPTLDFGSGSGAGPGSDSGQPPIVGLD